MNWPRDEGRERGPRGFIGFAVSARMSEALHKAILRIPEEGWQAHGKVKHFAVVTNIGEWKAARLIQWHRGKGGTVEGVHDVVEWPELSLTGDDDTGLTRQRHRDAAIR